MSQVTDRIDAIQAELAEIRAAAEAEGAEQQAPDLSPEVVEAATDLAHAVAASIGVEMPLQAAEGSSLPVIELPPEFAQQGGVGVAVFVQRPPQ